MNDEITSEGPGDALRRRRPLGITLLGYGLLLLAVGQLPTWWQLLQGEFAGTTFFGFLAPTPLPQIEFALLWVFYVYAGIGMLRLDPRARKVFLAVVSVYVLVLLYGLVAGTVQVIAALGRETVAGGPAEEVQWLVATVLGLVLIGSILRYVVRRGSAFKPPRGEEGPSPREGRREEGEEGAREAESD